VGGGGSPEHSRKGTKGKGVLEVFLQFTFRKGEFLSEQLRKGRREDATCWDVRKKRKIPGRHVKCGKSKNGITNISTDYCNYLARPKAGARNRQMTGAVISSWIKERERRLKHAVLPNGGRKRLM